MTFQILMNLGFMTLVVSFLLALFITFGAPRGAPQKKGNLRHLAFEATELGTNINLRPRRTMTAQNHDDSKPQQRQTRLLTRWFAVFATATLILFLLAAYVELKSYW